MRLESLIRTLESTIFSDRINTTIAIESLKKSQTGPRKFLGM